MKIVAFSIPGQPFPKQRVRKGKGHWYTPRETLEFQERIREAWEANGQVSVGSLRLAVRCTFVIAHSASNLRKDGEPRKSAPVIPEGDIDNYLKGVLDPLNGRLYKDDKQLMSAALSKRFAHNGEEPHTAVHFAAYGPDN